ncbi:MAG: hypothetical protein ISS82_00630 [Nanoarchaeota archaeon]|nr:hypothetical protein [Nanoarchaeota archaeon]
MKIQKENIILTEQDIINTYDERQQEQCRLYYKYKKIKKQNPAFGYKRIAKLLGHSYGKTRWWHANKHIPTPIQTVNWLKEKRLIPLTLKNPTLTLISKILGATFGDGGIDKNHNMIFLSSSELKALEDFKQDLIKIFGEEIRKNFDIRQGGINNTSYCQRNTNRKVIRFFKALGAPIGNKTRQNLFIPPLIKLNKYLEDQFYFAFFGSEAGIPKCRGRQTNTFDVAIGGLPEYHQNRIDFMNKIRFYLINKNIKSGKISINKSKSGLNQNTYIYRLLISTKVENMIKFLKEIELHYCYYKTDKLKNTINDVLIAQEKRVNGLKDIYL